MTRFIDILRIIFISPEFLLFLLLVALGLYPFDFILSLADQFKVKLDEWRLWYLGASTALCVWGIKLSTDLKAPLSGSNKLLYDWGGYQRLKDRVHISMVLLIALLVYAVVSSMLWKQVSPHAVLISMLGSLLLEGVISLNMLLAKQMMKEVFDSYS